MAIKGALGPGSAGSSPSMAVQAVALPSSQEQLTEQIVCVERELVMRRKHYPRWVKQGKITQAAADLEIDRMDAVLQSLLALRMVDGVPGLLARGVIKVEERERVLAIVARHMHSSPFIRVAENVRA